MPELTLEELSNPFTDVYNALWTLILRCPQIATIVSVGNRVNFGAGNRDPIKDTVQDGDLPELTIIPAGSNSVNLHATSSTTKIVRQYQIVVVTGDYRLDYRLLPLEFFLFAAMTGWSQTITALQWHGASYVKNTNLTALSDGESDSRRVLGLKGWSAIWAVDVEMHFQTAHLRELLGE